MKKLLTTSLLLLVSMTSRAQIAGNGPIQPMTINYSNQVGVGNWLTVQAALTDQCAKNGGLGQVYIGQGATPGDGPTVGGETTYTVNGCANVTILDKRGTVGASCYAYTNSTTYTQGNCVATGSTPTAGFPITIGSTGIAASSTTTTIAGLTLSNPSLTGTIGGAPTASGAWTFSSNITNFQAVVATGTLLTNQTDAAVLDEVGGTARLFSYGTGSTPGNFSILGVTPAGAITHMEDCTGTTATCLFNNIAVGSTGQTTIAADGSTSFVSGLAQVTSGGTGVFQGVNLEGQKGTSCANGTVSTDVACFGQIASSIPVSVFNINIQSAPYYASGSSFSTTGSTSSGTSVTVASCGDFVTASAGTQYGHQGVLISGGGSAGVTYYGTVSTCTGTAMVVSPGTSSTISAATTTATLTLNNDVITVASATGIHQFATASGTGIAANTYVIGVSGTSVTLSQAPTAGGSGVTVTFSPTVMHDDTAAIQAAITSAGYGTVTKIFFPGVPISGGTTAGQYNVNGAFQNTGTCNCILQVPSLKYLASTLVAPAQVELFGPVKPSPGGSSAAIIRTYQTSSAGDLIGGYFTASGTPTNTTNVQLNIYDMIFRSYDNPSITMIGGFNLAALQVSDFDIDTGYVQNCGYESASFCTPYPTFPTNTNGIAIVTPGIDAIGGYTAIRGGIIDHYYNGLFLGEHAYIDGVESQFGNTCAFLDNPSPGHMIQIGYISCEHNVKNLAGSASDIHVVSMENESLYGTQAGGVTTLVYDPSNTIDGIVNYEDVDAGQSGGTTVVKNGGAGVYVQHLNTALTNVNAQIFSGSITSTSTTGYTAVNAGVTTNIVPSLPATNFPFTTLLTSASTSDSKAATLYADGDSSNGTQITSQVIISTDKAVADSNAQQLYFEEATGQAKIETLKAGNTSSSAAPIGFYPGGTVAENCLATNQQCTFAQTINTADIAATDPTTPSSTAVLITNFLCPNISGASPCATAVGVNESANNNAGGLGFIYTGSGSTNNQLELGFYNTVFANVVYPQRWWATGDSCVGCTTDPGKKFAVGSASQATIDASGNIATTGTETLTALSTAGCVTNTSGGLLGSTPCQLALSNPITSATGGSGTGTVTCLTAACTNLRGTYSVAGGTFTTGNFLTLVWPTTTTAYVCTATMNGGTGFLGVGNDVATATGMNISAGLSILGVTVTVNYSCKP